MWKMSITLFTHVTLGLVPGFYVLAERLRAASGFILAVPPEENET